MNWLDLLGWGGSALLIFSLLQARILRLRVLNLIACVILTVFNAALEVWPMVAMNVVLSVINLWFIWTLIRHRHDDASYEVLQVRPEDTYLQHILRVHEPDIRRFQPDFTGTTAGTTAYLVQKGDETVGVVLLETVGAVGRLVLDYVTPRYRDFSPGEFVWRKSGLLRDQGLARVETSPLMVGAYYDRLGFHREDDAYVLDL